VRARPAALAAVDDGGMADIEMAGGARWMEVRDDLLFFFVFPFFRFFS
jgi:hypothetical protein